MRFFRPLPRADAYFARRFLVFAALCLLALLALVIVGDLYSKIDDFAAYARRNDAGVPVMLGLVVKYYAAFAPALVLRWMLPLSLLLAAVLTATAASVRNEYTALRASGVSMRRALLPILVPTLLAAYAVEWSRDWYLPGLLRKSFTIASELRPRAVRSLAMVLHDGDARQSVALGHFDQSGFAHNLRIEIRDRKSLVSGSGEFEAYTAEKAALQFRVMDVAAGDARECQWVPDETGRHVRQTEYRRFETRWEEPLPTYVTEAMLERQTLGEAVLPWSDLARLADEDMDARFEMQRRRAEPWGAALLVMAGVSVVLRRSLRGGAGGYVQNLVAAVVVCTAYYGLRVGFHSVGETEWLGAYGPVFGVWLPNLAAAGIGGWFYQNMES